MEEQNTPDSELELQPQANQIGISEENAQPLKSKISHRPSKSRRNRSRRNSAKATPNNDRIHQFVSLETKLKEMKDGKKSDEVTKTAIEISDIGNVQVEYGFTAGVAAPSPQVSHQMLNSSRNSKSKCKLRSCSQKLCR